MTDREKQIISWLENDVTLSNIPDETMLIDGQTVFIFYITLTDQSVIFWFSLAKDFNLARKELAADMFKIGKLEEIERIVGNFVPSAEVLKKVAGQTIFDGEIIK